MMYSISNYAVKYFDFIEKIETNYLNDFYQSSNFTFDPDLRVEEYAEIKMVRVIPEIMFKKINGKVITNPIYFTEDCSPELDALIEEFLKKISLI